MRQSLGGCFDWLAGSERGQTQDAYQILVATSADLAAKDGGDLWDSGKVAQLDYGLVPNIAPEFTEFKGAWRGAGWPSASRSKRQ